MPVKMVRYASPNPGPHLVILGSVHGNETCGAEAIKKILAQIETGQITIMQGSVTFVPVVNRLAYERGVRYVDHNLNRDLRRRENPADYEDVIGNIICPLIEECNFLLDLHSNHSEGQPFVFAGPPNQEEESFRRSLGPDLEVFGWTEAYARITGKVIDSTSIGTVEYARLFGATAVTLECGQHNDPKSVDVAITAIRNALDYCRISPANGFKTRPVESRLRIQLEGVYKRDDEGRLARNWRHADRVKKGEPIAYKEDGTVISATDDGFVLLPHSTCLKGDEWFYFGVEDKGQKPGLPENKASGSKKVKKHSCD